MGKTTILQVLPALDIGGVEEGTIAMAAAINRAGCRALVASGPGRLLSRLRYNGGVHYELALQKSFSPWMLCRKVSALRQLIRQENVALVHARSRYPALVAALACRKEGVPLVTTWHGVHEARSWPKRWYNRALLRGDYVIAVSAHSAERLKKDYGVSGQKIRLIPRGTDPWIFSPISYKEPDSGAGSVPDSGPESGREGSRGKNWGEGWGTRVQKLLEKWNVPDRSRLVIVPGRLTRWKGQHVVLSALEQMRRREEGMGRGSGDREKLVIVFVGPESDPSYAQSLYRQAASLDLLEQIRFAGACEDMPAAYYLADLVLIPSLKPEPFGRVAVEAQMMGCPVIGSDLGGLAETILQQEMGRIVAPGDSAGWADAIKDIMEQLEDPSPETQKKIVDNARRARERMVSDYTVKQMQEATLAVYDEILKTSLRENFLSSFSVPLSEAKISAPMMLSVKQPVKKQPVKKEDKVGHSVPPVPEQKRDWSESYGLAERRTILGG